MSVKITIEISDDQVNTKQGTTKEMEKVPNPFDLFKPTTPPAPATTTNPFDVATDVSA